MIIFFPELHPVSGFVSGFLRMFRIYRVLNLKSKSIFLAKVHFQRYLDAFFCDKHDVVARFSFQTILLLPGYWQKRPKIQPFLGNSEYKLHMASKEI